MHAENWSANCPLPLPKLQTGAKPGLEEREQQGYGGRLFFRFLPQREAPPPVPPCRRNRARAGNSPQPDPKRPYPRRPPSLHFISSIPMPICPHFEGKPYCLNNQRSKRFLEPRGFFSSDSHFFCLRKKCESLEENGSVEI